MRRGSITVFFALVLSIVIVLICTSIESVKMMCARTQIANSADVGMYSLFAQYDKYLLEHYDLFYVDASYGTGELRMSQVYRTVEDYMDPILEQNYLDLSICSGGITSFGLATDDHGQPFYGQVVSYMRDTLGIQGVQLLLDKIQENTGEVEEQQEMRRQAEDGNSMADYDDEMARAGNESAQAEAQLPDGGAADVPEVSAENPIDTIREIQKMGILELVVSDPASLSEREIETGDLVSHRELERGMGVLAGDLLQNSAADQALFQEYIMQKCGTYAHPSKGSGLKYQAEYIIGQSGSDKENLKKTANRLLLIREGVNFAHLYTDPGKRSQSAALAAAIASGFLVPPAAGVIEMVILLCWSFAESVLDVKALFDGSRVPLLKNVQNWNLSLENLPNLLGELTVQRSGGDERGLNYEDYLRALLFLESTDSKIMGSMDMIEADIRNQPGRENFRMDCCLDAMEVEIDVRVNHTRTYTVLHQYGYHL